MKIFAIFAREWGLTESGYQPKYLIMEPQQGRGEDVLRDKILKSGAFEKFTTAPIHQKVNNEEVHFWSETLSEGGYYCYKAIERNARVIIMGYYVEGVTNQELSSDPNDPAKLFEQIEKAFLGRNTIESILSKESPCNKAFSEIIQNSLNKTQGSEEKRPAPGTLKNRDQYRQPLLEGGSEPAGTRSKGCSFLFDCLAFCCSCCGCFKCCCGSKKQKLPPSGDAAEVHTYEPPKETAVVKPPEQTM